MTDGCSPVSSQAASQEDQDGPWSPAAYDHQGTPDSAAGEQDVPLYTQQQQPGLQDEVHAQRGQAALFCGGAPALRTAPRAPRSIPPATIKKVAFADIETDAVAARMVSTVL